MKNQIWAGLGSQPVHEKKSLGPIMNSFWGRFLCFQGQKIFFKKFENIIASALKSRHEKHGRMFARMFCLFQCSRNIQCLIVFL